VAAIGAFALSVATSACGDDDPMVVEQNNLVEQAIEAGSFTTLVAAVQAAGLEETLATGGPFTVFAPTDEAFAQLPPGTVDALLADPPALAEVLTFHVVDGILLAEDVVAAGTLTTLQGGTLTVDTSDGVKVNGVSVISTDIRTENGVIHVIDEVLIPPAE
jgi:uncharacterized surface protein with fasciclin (FAS1) repeats